MPSLMLFAQLIMCHDDGDSIDDIIIIVMHKLFLVEVHCSSSVEMQDRQLVGGVEETTAEGEGAGVREQKVDD